MGGHVGAFQHTGETHDDGCPGAWSRCGFAQSLLKYYRVNEGSGPAENIRLSRTRDPLVIEAVAYWEIEQARVRRRAMELAEV